MKHVVIGTAGHIDHGKSSLVLALTGTDPDRLQEEKARGITIDLGFAHTIEDGMALSFVDVPGHERFVRNMLAGVGGMDLVMLHVAADESVMPQTREHFDICRLLRFPPGLVVITKSDLVDAATLDVVRLEVQDLVAGSFLEGRPLSPSPRERAPAWRICAARSHGGAGARTRPSEGPPRLPIDRVFSMKGFGTVVTGTLIGGRLRSTTSSSSSRRAGPRRFAACRCTANAARGDGRAAGRGQSRGRRGGGCHARRHADAARCRHRHQCRRCPHRASAVSEAAAPWRARSLPSRHSRAAWPRGPPEPSNVSPAHRHSPASISRRRPCSSAAIDSSFAPIRR